jgi:hypothetical protein
MMAATDERHIPGPAASRNPARKLMRPAIGLVAVMGFQLLLASVFLGVLHKPALHNAPVAVVGSAQLASAVEHGAAGTIRLVPQPSAAAARAAIGEGQAYGAIVSTRTGDELLTASADSPGTANILTEEFTLAAAKAGVRLQIRDLEPLPASDPAGTSAYYLVLGWMLGGYIGATVLSFMIGGMRSSSVRHALLRLGLLAGYAVCSGLLGALLIGPVMGIVSGYNLALAGVGMLLVFGVAAATAALQGALGMPGTLIAIIAMVVFGNPTAGASIATPLLASPWNLVGRGLPPGAGLSAARSVIYLGGSGLAQPLAVLSVYAVAGSLGVLAFSTWRQRRHAAQAAVAVAR